MNYTLPQRLIACALLTLPSADLYAGYGPSAIGLGTESVGMAGADLAENDSAFASVTNPAGLTNISNGSFASYIEAFSIAGQEYSDSVGNKSRVSNTHAAIFGSGIAFRPSPDSNWVVGLGAVAQGGVGYTFEELTTTSGNQDELSALFGIFRIAPSLGWQATEKLNLGASINFNISQAEQKVFPNTAIAPSGNDPGFAGLELAELSGLSVTYRLGVEYNYSDLLSFGATYSSRTPLKLENGEGTLNYAGLGKVHYNDVSIRGLSLASELGIGVSYQITDRLRLASDITWYDWSRAFRRTRVQLNHGDNSAAPSHVSFTSQNQFRDQIGLAVGAEYRWSDKTVLRAGAAYGRNPIPDAALSPTFGVNSEYHIATGFAYKFDKHWTLHGNMIYVFPVAQTYENTSLPLGQFGQVRSEVWDIGFAIERDW